MVQASTSAAFVADKVMAGTVIAMVMVAATVATAVIATAGAITPMGGAINPMGRAFAFKPTGAGATEPQLILMIRAPLSRGAFLLEDMFKNSSRDTTGRRPSLHFSVEICYNNLISHCLRPEKNGSFR